MGNAAEKIHYTYAEYLAAEEKSELKHEWLNGEIFCMAGGTPEHAALAASVSRELGNALQSRPCRVFSSDLRVKIKATGLSTYPDISVVCGQLELDAEDRNAVLNPLLLVEVLSESSEGYDRGEKFAHYRRIPSLREYVMVSQQNQRIEVYRRSPEGLWILHEAGPGENIELASLGCSLSVDEIYKNPLANP
jgi:Uma2 family endonuclease